MGDGLKAIWRVFLNERIQIMGIVEDKIKELKTREAKTLQMGGEKAVARQHEKNKLTARERLNLLFDAGTFREIDMFVNHRCVNFGMESVDIPADGVITGHGLVNGRPLFAFLQCVGCGVEGGGAVRRKTRLGWRPDSGRR